MRRAGLIPLVLLLATMARLSAQQAPNVAGTWILNTTMSQNIGMMTALKDTVTITQTPREITIRHVTSFQGQDGSRELRYDLTGKAGTNEGPMGDRNETVTKWVGTKLVTTWTKDGAVAGTKTVSTETCSMSPDGKTLTFETVRGANAPVIMVFEKEQ